MKKDDIAKIKFHLKWKYWIFLLEISLFQFFTYFYKIMRKIFFFLKKIYIFLKIELKQKSVRTSREECNTCFYVMIFI